MAVRHGQEEMRFVQAKVQIDFEKDGARCMVQCPKVAQANSFEGNTASYMHKAIFRNKQNSM